MRYLVAFLLLSQTALGDFGFNRGFSCAPPRRIIRSYSAPVYKQQVVKEVIREVPQYVYPVAQQYSPNPYLMQAQFKQYFNQLQRMQDDLQTSLAETQAFSQQFTQQQITPAPQLQPQYQYQQQQAYGQQYTQQPQPYGAYSPQQPQGYATQSYAPPSVQQQDQCPSCKELLRTLLGPHLQQPQNHYHQPEQLPPPQYGTQAEEGYASVLSNNCANCHSGSNPKGGFDLSRLAVMNMHERFEKFQRAARREMPPPDSGKPPLTDEELSILFREMFSPQEQGVLMNKSAMNRKPTATTASLVVDK